MLKKDKPAATTEAVYPAPLQPNRLDIKLPDYGFMGAVNESPKVVPEAATEVVATTSVNPIRTPNVAKTPQAAVATTPKTNFDTGVGRETDITSNIEQARTSNPNSFKSRNTFNQAFGYETADAAKKALLDKEFTKYNAEDTANRAPIKKKVTTPKTETVITTDIFSQTQEQLDDTKRKQLDTFKVDDEKMAERDLSSTLGALKTTNERLANLYGINADGSVDENRPNSLAMTAKKSLEDYKKVQNDNADKFESARKSRVVSQIYQKLASRRIDVSKIPQEQLIALSDEVGAQAFSDIYQAKTDTINRIQAKEDVTMNTLNALKEKGTISENDYTNSVAQVKSAFDKTKQTINKNFANDLFGLADKATARKETKSTTNLNFLNALTDKVGLPISSAQKYVATILKKLPNATPAQIQAELMANPAFVKEANDIIAQKQAFAAQEAELKRAETLSKIEENKAQTARANRPASSG